MKSILRSQQGMTLVEVMVAGVIGLIPATIIIVLYATYSSQLRENSARLALQRQYETVVQEVAAYTRMAHRIRSTTPCSEPCSSSVYTGNTVYFFDSDCTLFAGLRIFGDALQEYQQQGEGWTWIPFNAGSPVLVNQDNSYFIVPGCGNRITLHLRLTTVDHDTYHLEPPESVYRCRN